MTKSSTITTKARLYIDLARAKHDFSFEDIAFKCDVNEGSVKRWYSTGRARKSAIQPLVDLVGDVNRPIDEVVAEGIELYWSDGIRGPVQFTYKQFKALAGRDKLRESFLGELSEAFLDEGFYLLDNIDDDGVRKFALVRVNWLFNKRAKKITRQLREEIYGDKVQEMEEEDEFFASPQ